MDSNKLNNIVEEVKDQIISAPEESRGEVLAEVMANIWGDDVGRAMGVLNLSQKAIFNYNSASREVVEKQYLTRKLHEWLYENILTEGVSISEAMSRATESFEVTLEYLEEARNTKHARGRMKEVVTEFDNNSIQKSMIAKGVVTKKELQNHNTPTGQFNRLLKGVKLHKTLVGIEEDLQETKELVQEKAAVVDIVQNQTEETNRMLGLEGLSLGKRVQHCKNNKLTQAKTAKLLDVSVRSVKRYWNL